MASIAQRSGVLGFDNAAHLLRRATFGPNKALINSYAGLTAAQAINQLFTFTPSNFPRPLLVGQTFIPTTQFPTTQTTSIDGNDVTNIRYWMLNNFMIDNSIQHKITFFLHTIFITDQSNIYGDFDYWELLRWHADGSIKELSNRITRNHRMLYYLNNRDNRASSPNENYAREFLELFTIQKGPQIATGNYTTYTEADVQTAAKVLTGFDGSYAALATPSTRLTNVDPVTLIPQGTVTTSKHNITNKVFSDAFLNNMGNPGVTIVGTTTQAGMIGELDQFVTMVFNQQATALSFARRIYRFFVGRNITLEIETDIITPLANTLKNNNYNIKIALTQLLSSLHFFDEDDSIVADEVIGAKVKDPMTHAMGIFKEFNVTVPDYVSQNAASYAFINSKINGNMSNSGFGFYFPFSVAGYPAYTEVPELDKIWISPLSLRVRYVNYIDQLISGYTYNGVLIKLDTVLFVRNSGNFSNPASADTLINEFYDLLFTSRPEGGRNTYFRNGLLGGLSPINWQNDWNAYLNTNVATTVKVAIDRFVKILVKSPEYQVH